MGLRVNRPERLAEDLREAREAVDYSQRELAEHFGVSTRTVQYWEAGQTPQPKHRRAIRDWIRFVNCEEAA